jgi:hypothetical protein
MTVSILADPDGQAEAEFEAEVHDIGTLSTGQRWTRARESVDNLALMWTLTCGYPIAAQLAR